MTPSVVTPCARSAPAVRARRAVRRRHGVSTDGAIYFSQLRSVIFDRDLDVAREFAFLGQPPRPSHFVPIGPTLLWLPLYVVVRPSTASAARSARGVRRPAIPWRSASAFPTCARRCCRCTASARPACGRCTRGCDASSSRASPSTATLLLFGATTLFWYMVYEPTMTHAASFGMRGVVRRRCRRLAARPSHAASRHRARALLALAFLMRPQEALFVLFAAALITRRPRVVAGAPAPRPAPARLGLIGAVPFLRFRRSTPSCSTHRRLPPHRRAWLSRSLHSRWLDTLFFGGMVFLSWSPVVYVAVLGTSFYWRARAVGAGDAASSAPDGMDQRLHGGLECRLVVRRAALHQLPLSRAGAGAGFISGGGRPRRLGLVAVAAVGWNYLLMVQIPGQAVRRTSRRVRPIVRQQAPC